jgi:hypothetical protein
MKHVVKMSMVLVSAFGCNSPQLLLEDEWKTTPCVDFNDCFTAHEGDICDQLCPTTAVHADAFEEYLALYDETVAGCFPPAPQVPDNGANPCPQAAVCVESLCVLVDD